ncbi:ferritin-like domain-containing protein [Desulforamulus aquiferis]|uniref:Ferritin family protein n=1 Tax=Desulforamulus aquiferis TaxID=1397668 RepID=A0AAW7ZL16_9FIRM|nr:ferritin family protein [Desulforamulus aquiferis]MDO7789111.1 ferritin family protein [Desulforamulus aquiferis]RYD02863.1 hypothetical protein N752_22895 [Desulforamulus aquiferis]
MNEQKCLNLSAVVDMAASNSAKGMAYYKRMEELAKEQLAGEIFHRLAAEEEEHRRALIKVAQAEAEKGQTSLDEETYCYLCSLGEGLVFPHHETVEFNASSPREALELGIQAKKDAMLLYHELQNRCVSKEAKNILMHLLEEEQKDLLELRHYIHELCPKGCNYPPNNDNNN